MNMSKGKDIKSDRIVRNERFLDMAGPGSLDPPFFFHHVFGNGLGFDQTVHPKIEAPPPPREEPKKDDSWQCDICKEYYTGVNTLEQHVKKHHSVYKCDACEFMANCYDFDNTKYQHTHDGKSLLTKYFKCEKCPYMTKKRYTIKYHNDSIHRSGEREKKFKCHLCLYRALKLYMLKNHIRHTHDPSVKKEKYFKCNLCKYMSWKPYMVRRHFRSNHDSTAHCEHCDVKKKVRVKKSDVPCSCYLWFCETEADTRYVNGKRQIVESNPLA